MTFAFLFGLSMDCEVFILHLMREEYDANGDTDHAIVQGLAMTGKLVTCAALILFLAFVAMAPEMGRWNWWLPGWLDWLAPKPASETVA